MESSVNTNLSDSPQTDTGTDKDQEEDTEAILENTYEMSQYTKAPNSISRFSRRMQRKLQITNQLLLY